MARDEANHLLEAYWLSRGYYRGVTTRYGAELRRVVNGLRGLGYSNGRIGRLMKISRQRVGKLVVVGWMEDDDEVGGDWADQLSDVAFGYIDNDETAKVYADHLRRYYAPLGEVVRGGDEG